MSDALRQAARRALGERFGPAPDIGRVVRMVVDVEIDGAAEMVSVHMRAGELAWACTCGKPRCPHARTALMMIAGREPNAEASTATDRITQVWEPTTASGGQDVRTVDESDQAERADTSSLASILEDVLIAVVRSGIAEGASPAIQEALERLIKAAPQPLPLGISRWVGRLKDALARREIDGLARVLDGATRVVEDLRAQSSGRRIDAAARSRILSWLGALTHDVQGVERLSDLTLVEVARERLPGVERGGVERRYLVDVANGRVYREERAPWSPAASLGPCPRLITVGLASVELGAEPRRIRLLQYSTTPQIPREAWDQLSGWALRTWSGLAERYREEIASFPGLAEPFALVSPDSIAHDPMAVLLDEGGRPLPLSNPDHPAELRFLDALLDDASAGTPRWFAGRLLDDGATLSLLPLSCATSHQGSTRYARV